MKISKKTRGILKKTSILKWSFIFLSALKRKHKITQIVKELIKFNHGWQTYRKLPQNKLFNLSVGNLYPRLFDSTNITPIDPVYFYQDTWCAEKIFENKPEHHYDIGSSAELVGIVSKFTPTTMVDIRPLSVTLPSLSFKKGSILELPFTNNSLYSVSSICVIEHIGLGRYGDQLDQFGSEKAAKELTRVLANGGNLYISVPIDTENTTYFNAHRAFTRDYVLELFKPLKLVEEKYIYGNDLTDGYSPLKGFGTGLYHLKNE